MHDLVRELLASPDGWSRSNPVHLTGSALVVHPPTGRVLLRRHGRMQRWMQVGGHADPGETDPLEVAMREAREETGLDDLVPLGDGPVQTVVVPVPARGDEPAHEHADVRYLLATRAPDAVASESDATPVRWMTIDEALAHVTEDNLRELLRLAASVVASVPTEEGPCQKP